MSWLSEGVKTVGNVYKDFYGGIGGMLGIGGGGGNVKYGEAPSVINEEGFTDPTKKKNLRSLEDERRRILTGGRELLRPQEQFRGMQVDQAGRLGQRARGEGPSLAELTGKQQLDDLTRQAASIQSSRLGTSPTLAHRAYQEQVADASQRMAGQVMSGKLQEQQAAEQMLSGVVGQGRAGDLGVVDLMGKREDLIRSYVAMGLTLDQAEFQAQQELEKLRVQEQLGVYGAETGLEAARAEAKGDMFGGLLQGAATGAGMVIAASDIRVKKKIKKGDKEIGKFLDSFKPYEYEYKSEGFGKGKHVSPMAQDLEKTKLGKSMVEVLGDGTKVVNYGKGFGAMLAAQSDLHSRMKKVEGNSDAKR